MTFYSLRFFIVLLVGLAEFWVAPDGWRTGLLLLYSYAFCLFFGAGAAGTLFAVSLGAYAFGLAIGAAKGSARGFLTLLAVSAQAALLGYFKCWSLIMGAFSRAGHGGAAVSLLAPVGISYYVFQSLSYVVDVYLEKLDPERNPARFFLYLSFFPKLMQGPIERAGDLLPQLKAGFRFDYARAVEGGRLILIGLFKKAVVADRLAFVAGAVLDRPADFRGLPLLVGVYAFTLQLYFDFAGYTDIARGLGKLFGVDLAENFDRPFSSTNIQEFWRRWHMSFSFWLRDYLFIPLFAAFRDLGTAGIVLASMITFAIAGMWHGPTPGFLVFGLMHGVYMAGSILTLKSRDRWLKNRGWNGPAVDLFRRAVTFNMVAASLCVFRCGSLSDAAYVFGHLWRGHDLSVVSASLSSLEIAGLGAALFCLLRPETLKRVEKLSPPLFYAALANVVIFLGIKSDASFIYFKF